MSAICTHGSGFSRGLRSRPCEGRGGLGRGAVRINPNRGHPLPASPCLRRGRGQGESSRLKPLLQEPEGSGGFVDARVVRFEQLLHRPEQLAERVRRLVALALVERVAHQLAQLLAVGRRMRSEEHTSELQSLMRISYAVFCLKKKKKHTHH